MKEIKPLSIYKNISILLLYLYNYMYLYIYILLYNKKQINIYFFIYYNR